MFIMFPFEQQLFSLRILKFVWSPRMYANRVSLDPVYIHMNNISITPFACCVCCFQKKRSASATWSDRAGAIGWMKKTSSNDDIPTSALLSIRSSKSRLDFQFIIYINTIEIWCIVTHRKRRNSSQSVHSLYEVPYKRSQSTVIRIFEPFSPF